MILQQRKPASAYLSKKITDFNFLSLHTVVFLSLIVIIFKVRSSAG